MNNDSVEFYDWYHAWWKEHNNDALRPTTYEMMLAAWEAGRRSVLDEIEDAKIELEHGKPNSILP